MKEPPWNWLWAHEQLRAVCRSPDLCMGYGDRAVCGPCGSALAAAGELPMAYNGCRRRGTFCPDCGYRACMVSAMPIETRVADAAKPSPPSSEGDGSRAES